MGIFKWLPTITVFLAWRDIFQKIQQVRKEKSFIKMSVKIIFVAYYFQ